VSKDINFFEQEEMIMKTNSKKKLTDLFGIDSESLAKRREFLRISTSDRNIMLKLRTWANEFADPMAKEFYEWQFSFSATKVFFENFAKKHGLKLDDLRLKLEATQAEYFRTLFTGADNNWDIDYFEKRLTIGAVHDRIDLPFKWYIGSYAQYEALVYKYLKRNLRTRFRSGNYMQAIKKIMNYDMQAVGDSFLMSTIASLGLQLDKLESPRGSDRTELVPDYKAYVKTLRQQATTMANGELSDPILQEVVPGELGTAFSQMVKKVSGTLQSVVDIVTSLGEAAFNLKGVSEQLTGTAETTAAESGKVAGTSQEVNSNVHMVAGASEEMTASIREISENVNEASKIAHTAVDMANNTNNTVAKLSDSSQEIGKVISVINNIAEQTNLLALNATIEAARAGDAGKGFAVVANEVKELARETAKSTEEISEKIETIQRDTQEAVQAIKKIANIIEEISNTQTTIASAVEEQTVTTNEIARNIAEASQGSEQIAGSISSVAEGVMSTQDGAQKTQLAAQTLSELAERLAESISTFKMAANETLTIKKAA
jgi:methyl-accepting chemotaxis protein